MFESFKSSVVKFRNVIASHMSPSCKSLQLSSCTGGKPLKKLLHQERVVEVVLVVLLDADDVEDVDELVDVVLDDVVLDDVLCG